MLKKISRGNYRGNFSNAKPIYVLTLIEIIEHLKKNVILYPNIEINDLYQINKELYDRNCNTPLIAPFFHLDSEPFYELVWKSETRPQTNSHTPSAKYLRENLEYAKLDDDLWELLQDPENRAYLKQAIIDRYLKN